VDVYSISSDELRVSVKRRGAELCRLRTGAGLDLLWDGDPAFWSGQAPVLFPVVGALEGGLLRHQGQAYPMPRHGFARERDFRMVMLSAHACRFRLEDDPGTRASYPFPFRLDIGFALLEAELTVEYELHNPGDHDLPASFGAHPAFRWPLLPGQDRTAHRLEFEKREADLLPGVSPGGLLTGPVRPSPLKGRILALQDSLFTEDALVFNPVQSRALRYSGPGAPTLQVGWDGFPDLGVWSKPGAGFVCIEPWRGHASPVGFDGEFTDKPGVFLVRPGAAATARYTVRVLPPDQD